VVKYSRLIVLFSVSFICVAVNYWLVTAGHYRLPLFVLLGCVLLIVFALRKLPPVTTDVGQIRSNQLRAASSLRRLGFIFAGGLVLNVLNFISGGFKDLPVWLSMLLFCWGGFLTWGCFWIARRYKKGIAEGDFSPSAMPKQ